MTDMLDIRGLHVEVDGKEILHDLALMIPKGEVHALLGPNGSGKTSLMMTIMGFPAYRVTQGRILFDGQNVTQLDLTERARLGIAISHQRPPTIAGVKLRQIIDYVAVGAPQQHDEIGALVKASHTELLLDRDINAGLSGGEIKRSELLQLLVARPRFAMMDEPDSGVDLDALGLLGEMINALFARDPDHPAKRNTGLIITHTGQILKYVHADKAHVMMEGRIACSANPSLVFETVSECGYVKCVDCLREKEGHSENDAQ